MAIPSSVLAWRIPGTGEPGGLPSMGRTESDMTEATQQQQRQWFRQERVCLQCGRPGFDPWVGRFPGEGNGNPLQSSCLEDPMDRGGWRATVHALQRVGHN